jgi:large subunit ribosomal protein L9
MKVILLKDIEKLGKTYDVVEVKDGFARNYLIPQKKAIPLTDKNLKYIEEQKKKILREKETEKKKACELAKKLEGKSINVLMKVHDNDQLYGSVTAQKISEALEQEGFKIDKKCIILDEPIKSLGVFDCLIRLHPEVETKIKVWVVKE